MLTRFFVNVLGDGPEIVTLIIAMYAFVQFATAPWIGMLAGGGMETANFMLPAMIAILFMCTGFLGPMPRFCFTGKLAKKYGESRVPYLTTAE